MDVAQKIKIEPLVTDDPEVRLDHPASEQEIEYRSLMRKFWFAAVISVPVMIFSYPDFFPGLRDWMPMGSMNRRVIWGLLGLLTLPVMLWSGSQFYMHSCCRSLLSFRRSNDARSLPTPRYPAPQDSLPAHC